MSINLNNYGVVEGRLTKNPTFFANSDGSCKVALTVAAQDNFKRKDGTRSVQFVPLEHLIPASQIKDGKHGVYDCMHKGDLVAFQYAVKQNNYKDKAGNDVYGIVLDIGNVQLKESKATTDKRLGDAVAAAEAAAEAPAEA